jgi:hypothetical protein
MKRVLKALGYVWATPTTLFFLILFLLPMWFFGQFKPLRWADGAWEWVIVKDSFFYAIYGEAWAATTLGYCIMLNPDYVDNPMTHVHERRHVWQNWVLGPFFLLVYFIGYLISFVRGIWLHKTEHTNASVGWWFYYWNPLELDAVAHERDYFPPNKNITPPKQGHFLVALGGDKEADS